MINLIPTNVKEANSYGIKNQILMRWVLAFFVGIIGVVAIVLFGFYQINQQIAVQDKLLASTNERLKQQDIEGVRKKTTDIDSSIKLALKVLEQKVLPSKLIQRIGAVIPEGAVLLDIGLQDIQGGIDLVARAESYQAATQVQVNLSDPANNVFEKADIQSIDCITKPTPGSIEETYPCTVNIRALFGNNNPFLFVNQNPTEAENNDE